MDAVLVREALTRARLYVVNNHTMAATPRAETLALIDRALSTLTKEAA